MTINGEQVKLQGACGGVEKCDFDIFQKLAGEVSNVNDQPMWEHVCANGGDGFKQEYFEEFDHFLETATKEELLLEYMEDWKQ